MMIWKPPGEPVLASALDIPFETLRSGRALATEEEVLLTDKAIYEVAQNMHRMTVRERENILAFSRFVKQESRPTTNS